MSLLAPYAGFLLFGLLFTLLLSAVAFPISIALGLSLAHVRVGRSLTKRRFAKAFITIFRSLPELLVMFLSFYGINFLLNRFGAALGVQMPMASPFIAAVIALSIQFGAYSAEILRDAYRSLPPGLAEAGFAVGMTESKVRRRIVTPLMLRAALPSLGNLYLVLLKISALASVIGVDELTRRANLVSGAIKDPFLCFGVAALGYLLLTGLASLVQEFVFGRRFATGGRISVH
ncbi:ABC transporter permease subunit [Mesorhizobium sp. M0520]|uniref:amino acid ABC transporter permease n=1 Tax=Mesorhizobium sp. M0520 TaxID=2956957 RepID=UPI003339E516